MKEEKKELKKENVEQIENKEIIEKETKKEKSVEKKEKRIANKSIITTKNYTKEEIKTLIAKKYIQHNIHYDVMQEIVNTICNKEFSQIDTSITELSAIAASNRKISMEELKKFTIQIPIFMYKLNDIIGRKGLQMEISSYLNNLEITEKILEQIGGTEKERLRAAEYNAMIPTLTSIINSRVYYNLKNKLDYAGKVYDGLKKVLSSEIEELKIFGKDSGNK